MLIQFGPKIKGRQTQAKYSFVTGVSSAEFGIDKIMKNLFCFILVFCFIFCCDGANVQFFKERDFKGDMYAALSVPSCINVPTAFEFVNGSVRTTGCIAVYEGRDCSTRGHVVRSEESWLGALPHKYRDNKYWGYYVNSFRDCTFMERRPQVDFDYFERKDYKGPMVQFRDICKCINLPSFNTASDYHSANSYGNCFKFYKQANCVGNEDVTTHRIELNYLTMEFGRSIEPCHVSTPCPLRLKATIINIEPTTKILKLMGSLQKVAMTTKQTLINYGETTQEYNYEAVKEITETIQFYFSDELSQMTAINFEEDTVNLETVLPFLSNASSLLRAGLEKEVVNTTNVFRVQETIRMEPCMKYEVSPFFEIAENAEFIYRTRFKIIDEGNGTERMSGTEIHDYLKDLTHLNDSDAFTAIVEAPMKLIVSYGVGYGVDVSSTLIVGCRHKFY